MQPQPKPTRATGDTGVHKEVERLGLRTHNRDSNTTRPKFQNAAVIRMYRQEMNYLFAVLCVGEGSVLSRNDPQLFDKELNDLLKEFGPLIWPMPGEGSRDHLRQPQADTLYKEELVYPRDSAV
jgi:hypothetical protein